MLNKIASFSVKTPYSIVVVFNDGVHGEHDFSEHVKQDGEMRIALRDPSYFARVFLEYGALTWPNGYDMCPDWLRMEMEAAGELHLPQAAE